MVEVTQTFLQCSAAMRGEGCVAGEGYVAGEGELVGVPKFHSRCKCTTSLTNIRSDWMSNASSSLCIILQVVVKCIPLNVCHGTYRVCMSSVKSTRLLNLFLLQFSTHE